MNFRADRMANVFSTQKMRIGKEKFTKEQLGRYQRYPFKMYRGEVQDVTMRFHNDIMKVAVDKLGKQNYVKAIDSCF